MMLLLVRDSPSQDLLKQGDTMKSKRAGRPSDLSLMKDASFVHMCQYLLTSKSRLRNSIALFSGLLFGGLYPVASYVIFHHAMWVTESPTKKMGLFVVGVSGIIASLSNVSSLLATMMKKNGAIPWCSAILLEGTAMIMGGDSVSLAVGMAALVAILFANTVKMTYHALIR